MIQLRAREAAAEVLSAKVTGTATLASLLAEDPPDVVVLCSAIAGVLGAVGQADYCGANACLDAFARSRQAWPGVPFVVSVNWDVWQEVGMAVDTPVPPALRAEREEHLRHGIRPSEGGEAFRRVLAGRFPEVVVSTRDFVARLDLAHAGPATAGIPETRTGDPAEPDQPRVEELHERPGLATVYAAPRSELERTIAGLWEELLGIDRVGIHDNFLELGGHSLMAIQLVARLREAFQIDLSLRSVFDAPTVAELAEMVRARQGG